VRRSAALTLLVLTPVAALASSGANANEPALAPDVVAIETHPFSAIVK
jgi:hypothetical protein